MANRHLSRSIVLQTLFECDFHDFSVSDIDAILLRNVTEFAPGMGDVDFMKKLLMGILKKRPDIDLIIQKAAPEWPLPKIAAVDRNVLRLGLYELLFADKGEVPAKVAINEAIELGKTFGGDASGRFVNGVLGSVYKEMGEPGKDDEPKKKKIKDIPFEQMPIEKLAGAITFAKHKDSIFIALVHDVFGHWTLPKGHIELDKDENTEAARVVGEEIGVPVTVTEELGSNEYVASDPEKGKLRKQVKYFLAEAPYQEIKLKADKGGLDDAKWFRIEDILELNFYNDIVPIVTKAVSKLAK